MAHGCRRIAVGRKQWATRFLSEVFAGLIVGLATGLHRLLQL